MLRVIEIRNFKSVQAKLDPEGLYWGPVKDALETLGKIGAGDARAAASRFSRTGAMAASIDYRVNNVPAPRWVVVRATATNKAGRSYPAILEFEGRYHHQNWLRDAIRRAQNQAAGMLNQAVREIESNWGRR